MGRESTKHSPRLDEQLKHETDSITHGAGVEAHSREGLLQETPTDGEPAPDASRRHDVPDAPGLGVSVDAAEDRAELARHISAATFPCRRDALLAAAEESFATDALLGQLRSLPADFEFENVQVVWATLGGEIEEPHALG